MTLQLFNYHSWATNTLIQHLRKLPLKHYQKEIQSVFPTVATTIQHIYDVDLLWLSRCMECKPLKGESIQFLQLDEMFHQIFLELADNQTLLSIVSQMRGHLNRMRYLELKTPNHMENAVS